MRPVTGIERRHAFSRDRLTLYRHLNPPVLRIPVQITMGANNRIKVSELQFSPGVAHASARTDASAGNHPRRSKRALRVDGCPHHMSSPATSGPRLRSSIHPSADCTLRRRSSDPAGNANEASAVRALNANPLVVSVRSPDVAAFGETLPPDQRTEPSPICARGNQRSS